MLVAGNRNFKVSSGEHKYRCEGLGAGLTAKPGIRNSGFGRGH